MAELARVNTPPTLCLPTFPETDAWEVRPHPYTEVTVLGGSSSPVPSLLLLPWPSTALGLLRMSINLVSNSYLDENSAKIRAKPVPWEVQATATFVETRSLI